jgi:hypothetical protein
MPISLDLALAKLGTLLLLRQLRGFLLRQLRAIDNVTCVGANAPCVFAIAQFSKFRATTQSQN